MNIVLSGLGLIVTGLCSWAVSAFVKWIDSKIEDKRLANLLSNATTIVFDAVQATYQEFVEVLKEQGKFDEAAQQEAKERATKIIQSQLTMAMQQYIEENFGDLQGWISSKIEATIYSLKR